MALDLFLKQTLTIRVSREKTFVSYKPFRISDTTIWIVLKTGGEDRVFSKMKGQPIECLCTELLRYRDLYHSSCDGKSGRD